jgi:hypothetical protein
VIGGIEQLPSAADTAGGHTLTVLGDREENSGAHSTAKQQPQGQQAPPPTPVHTQQLGGDAVCLAPGGPPSSATAPAAFHEVLYQLGALPGRFVAKVGGWAARVHVCVGCDSCMLHAWVTIDDQGRRAVYG